MGKVEESTRETESLAETLKRFSLTYEQHQMLHGTSIGLLASNVLSKRRRFTNILGLIAVLLAIQTCRGFFTDGAYIAWAVLTAIFSLWCWKRHAKTRTLDSAFTEFVERGSVQQPATHGLADELRLSFKLQYDEHQALHAGDPLLAAQRIVCRCRRNTWCNMIGALVISAIGLLWIVASFFNHGSIAHGLIVWMSLTSIVIFCVVAIALSDQATIRRIDQLVDQYNGETRATDRNG